ncbi:hypothetical protein B0H13DRAFT_1881708 [Mycena leptocephala]|nr:hypothetical protein B0H13DRAFT_1881708 [Mycena leptocephala]
MDPTDRPQASQAEQMLCNIIAKSPQHQMSITGLKALRKHEAAIQELVESSARFVKAMAMFHATSEEPELPKAVSNYLDRLVDGAKRQVEGANFLWFPNPVHNPTKDDEEIFLYVLFYNSGTDTALHARWRISQLSGFVLYHYCAPAGSSWHDFEFYIPNVGFKDTARIIRLDDHSRILIFCHKDIGVRANPDLSKWIKLADLSAVNENDGHYGHLSDRSSPLPPSSPPSKSSSKPEEESAAAAGPYHARHQSIQLQEAPVQPAVVAGPSHVSARSPRPSTEQEEVPVQPAAIAGPSQMPLASSSKRKATVDAQPAITKKQKLQQYGNSKEKPLEVAVVVL